MNNNVSNQNYIYDKYGKTIGVKKDYAQRYGEIYLENVKNASTVTYNGEEWLTLDKNVDLSEGKSVEELDFEQLVSIFLRGDLNPHEFKSALKAKGAERVILESDKSYGSVDKNGYVVMDDFVEYSLISFKYNDKDYVLKCASENAESSLDDKKSEVFTKQDISQRFLIPEDQIENYFESVSSVDGQDNLYVMKGIVLDASEHDLEDLFYGYNVYNFQPKSYNTLELNAMAKTESGQNMLKDIVTMNQDGSATINFTSSGLTFNRTTPSEYEKVTTVFSAGDVAKAKDLLKSHPEYSNNLDLLLIDMAMTRYANEDQEKYGKFKGHSTYAGILDTDGSYYTSTVTYIDDFGGSYGGPKHLDEESFKNSYNDELEAYRQIKEAGIDCAIYLTPQAPINTVDGVAINSPCLIDKIDDEYIYVNPSDDPSKTLRIDRNSYIDTVHRSSSTMAKYYYVPDALMSIVVFDQNYANKRDAYLANKTDNNTSQTVANNVSSSSQDTVLTEQISSSTVTIEPQRVKETDSKNLAQKIYQGELALDAFAQQYGLKKVERGLYQDDNGVYYYLGENTGIEYLGEGVEQNEYLLNKQGGTTTPYYGICCNDYDNSIDAFKELCGHWEERGYNTFSLMGIEWPQYWNRVKPENYNLDSVSNQLKQNPNLYAGLTRINPPANVSYKECKEMLVLTNFLKTNITNAWGTGFSEDTYDFVSDSISNLPYNLELTPENYENYIKDIPFFDKEQLVQKVLEKLTDSSLKIYGQEYQSGEPCEWIKSLISAMGGTGFSWVPGPYVGNSFGSTSAPAYATFNLDGNTYTLPFHSRGGDKDVPDSKYIVTKEQVEELRQYLPPEVFAGTFGMSPTSWSGSWAFTPLTSINGEIQTYLYTIPYGNIMYEKAAGDWTGRNSIHLIHKAGAGFEEFVDAVKNNEYYVTAKLADIPTELTDEQSTRYSKYCNAEAPYIQNLDSSCGKYYVEKFEINMANMQESYVLNGEPKDIEQQMKNVYDRIVAEAQERTRNVEQSTVTNSDVNTSTVNNIQTPAQTQASAPAPAQTQTPAQTRTTTLNNMSIDLNKDYNGGEGMNFNWESQVTWAAVIYNEILTDEQRKEVNRQMQLGAAIVAPVLSQLTNEQIQMVSDREDIGLYILNNEKDENGKYLLYALNEADSILKQRAAHLTYNAEDIYKRDLSMFADTIKENAGKRQEFGNKDFYFEQARAKYSVKQEGNNIRFTQDSVDDIKRLLSVMNSDKAPMRKNENGFGTDAPYEYLDKLGLKLGVEYSDADIWNAINNFCKKVNPTSDGTVLSVEEYYLALGGKSYEQVVAEYNAETLKYQQEDANFRASHHGYCAYDCIYNGNGSNLDDVLDFARQRTEALTGKQVTPPVTPNVPNTSNSSSQVQTASDNTTIESRSIDDMMKDLVDLVSSYLEDTITTDVFLETADVVIEELKNSKEDTSAVVKKDAETYKNERKAVAAKYGLFETKKDSCIYYSMNADGNRTYYIYNPITNKFIEYEQPAQNDKKTQQQLIKDAILQAQILGLSFTIGFPFICQKDGQYYKYSEKDGEFVKI